MKTLTLPERQAALLIQLQSIFPERFTAGKVLSAITGLAVKQPGHAELASALKQLTSPKATTAETGRLLKRMRGKNLGAYRLEGEYDTHAKSWRYWVAPADAPTQKEFIKEDLAEVAEELDGLTSPDAAMLSVQAIDAIVANPRRAESIIDRKERDLDRDIGLAQKEKDRLTIASDPELQQTQRDFKSEERAKQRAREQEKREQAAKDNGGPHYIALRDMSSEIMRVNDEWIHKITGEQYREIRDNGGNGGLRGFEKGKARESSLNPYLDANNNPLPPGHFEARWGLRRDPADPSKLTNQSYETWVPYSGLAAADALCTNTVREGGGLGASGFISDWMAERESGNLSDSDLLDARFNGGRRRGWNVFNF